ncbi:MAG: quinolinate synthase NadA [Pseudomonadota bacterium]|nr:quinolinate synthase NadA [Pseudomonadota bacterium]MDE3037909.1 quinolinate synthase NadA [Pseudomonadota bacterium]
MYSLETKNQSRTIPQSAARIDHEAEINRLRREMNAVILAHYYQEDEIQDIADHVGDSLDLARRAAETKADVIVFCGVKFMAEGAKILNPEKLVLLPDLKAGCSLEESCPPEAFSAFTARHPDHVVVTYINCSAEVKALSDIIVTSTNAEAILRQIPEDEKIIFAPDKYLGAYLMKKTGRDMLLWQGTCIVHERFSEQALITLKTRHPQAAVIAHPECPPALLSHAAHIGSTSSLIKYTEQRPGSEFIVLTEPGILHQMKKRSAGSTFHDVPGISGGACVSCNACPYMKLNTLEKIYACMKDRAPAIELSPELIAAARKPLDRMLEMSRGAGSPSPAEL